MPADTVAHLRGLDSTAALLREGYTFIPSRCRALGRDAFRTRLLLRPVVCMSGADAARAFYEPGRFTRRGAMPPTALALLQDYGSVAVLDGEAHRHRKRMFLAMLSRDTSGSLADAFEAEWRARLPAWERAGEVVLFDEAREVLTRAVCRWVGLPLSETEARDRTRELGAMVDAAGSVGPTHVRAHLLRARTERWARQAVEDVRAGRRPTAPGTVLHSLAHHRDLEGKLLEAKVAAVELINILRPTVAVDRFVTFCALALHAHPQVRERLPHEPYLEWFVHEVRRHYPFFPFVAGRALVPFQWRGHLFAPRDWVILDLFGTNHDPRAWEAPEAFRPERFARWGGSPFELIPQGGGDHEANHRCAGEWATIELMKRATRLLTTAMRYEVPPQDLSVSLSQMPALPRSRLVLRGVEALRDGDAPTG